MIIVLWSPDVLSQEFSLITFKYEAEKGSAETNRSFSVNMIPQRGGKGKSGESVSWFELTFVFFK
jgi:hypothetical protein